ncbi:MAG: anti-sigma factor [Thioalkalispiraceae bacterium]|jgi:anti-sigma-K factor RskA
MRYQDPELQDRLAAEYVMGNLTGSARRRFERLLIRYPELVKTVAAWMERLQPLNEDIAPLTPPASIWKNIESHIGESHPESLWTNLSFWRGFGILAASLLLVVSLYFSFGTPPTQHVVVVTNKYAQPEWVVKASSQSRHVMVQTITPPTLPEDKVCILWLVWEDGKTRSVGILSEKIGMAEMILPKDVAEKTEMANVVVSVETRGDNVDKPTGRIVFNGPWVRL